MIDWRSTSRPKLRSKAPPMTAFLQTAIPAVLTALIASRVGIVYEQDELVHLVQGIALTASL